MEIDARNNYLVSITKQFTYYKDLAEKAIEQLCEEQLFERVNQQSNSIAMIVNHLCGNMHSRFTDFLTTDGEKPSRNRDAEFAQPQFTKDQMMELWHNAWACLFTSLAALSVEDLSSVVYIRNQGHTVIEAINRQLAHYPYHIGQIVFIAKMYNHQNWESLTIAKEGSAAYNAQMFALKKTVVHFTDHKLK